jgi:predicted dehydrogenase
VKRQTTRREFIKTGAVAGAGFWVGATQPLYSVPRSANEKLNIGVIGCGGKGNGDARGVSSENIVALCDVDDKRAEQTYADFPKANRYHDFREMLEKEKTLDAVVVATPDHNHAAPSVMAMRLGLHCFTQKPLAHDIFEARTMRDVAREMKVATQMGNQGTSDRGLRRGVELIRAGALGKVEEVHVWTNRPGWPQGAKVRQPRGYKTPPPTLKWDLWLGTAPWRPFNDGYAPFNWRGWQDFGTGALGDMACHTANLPYLALELGQPTKAEVIRAEGLNPDTYPDRSTLLLHFPARGDKPPVKFYWYDGGDKPPASLTEGLELPSSGCLIVGDEGRLFSPDDYGREFDLLPEEKFKDYKGPDPSLPRSPGHYQEWLIACKGGAAAMSNFDYASQLTEAILLGNVALRAAATIEWDAEKMKVTNLPEANRFVRRDYRLGYSL